MMMDLNFLKIRRIATITVNNRYSGGPLQKRVRMMLPVTTASKRGLKLEKKNEEDQNDEYDPLKQAFWKIVDGFLNELGSV